MSGKTDTEIFILTDMLLNFSSYIFCINLYPMVLEGLIGLIVLFFNPKFLNKDSKTYN